LLASLATGSKSKLRTKQLLGEKRRELRLSQLPPAWSGKLQGLSSQLISRYGMSGLMAASVALSAASVWMKQADTSRAAALEDAAKDT